MSRTSVHRLIGLIQNVDGRYEPVSERGRRRLMGLFTMEGFDRISVAKSSLSHWKSIAKKYGFKIVTTRKIVKEKTDGCA